MQKQITLFVIVAMITASCVNNNNCFEDLASNHAEPVTIDTAVLFEPNTFEETCFEKRFYMATDTPVDSTFNIDEKVIELAQTETCYQLLSVKQRITNCN